MRAAGEADESGPGGRAPVGFAPLIDPFVDIDWLEENRGGVVLADCRWYLDGRSGRAAYEEGHLPGAVFVDLEEALCRVADPAEAGRHPLAEPADFAAAMGALGIGEEDVVVAYDDAGGVIAARLVWMLRATGHEAALLDGGLAAWRGELETAPAARAPRELAVREWPVERLATIEEAAGAALLIDARQRERYLGEPDDLDPRAGHIPGARSVPCRENLDAEGRLLPVADLRANFPFDEASGVVSSCGSGVTACHNLLAMEQAGLGVARLFPGSWSQWSRDPSRPAETAAPGAP